VYRRPDPSLPPPMPIRALLFDLDDTLLETHDSHLTALAAACSRAVASYPGWTEAALRDAFHHTYHTLEARLEAGELGRPTQILFRTRIFEETLQSCGLSPELGRLLADVYLEERRRGYRLYDDVRPALEQVAGAYQLVIVTNGLSDLQREKVEAVGLAQWFSNVVVSGELGSWKPEPAIFLHALALAGVEPPEALMVGDSLERDVAGASGAGIRTLWMRRYPHLQPIDGIRPDWTADSLTALPGILEGIV
jgi:putative hydrolase of the HAD superfamily